MATVFVVEKKSRSSHGEPPPLRSVSVVAFSQSIHFIFTEVSAAGHSAMKDLVFIGRPFLKFKNSNIDV